MHLGFAFTVLAGLAAAAPQIATNRLPVGGVGGVVGGQVFNQLQQGGMLPGTVNQFQNPGLRMLQPGLNLQPNRQFISCPQAQFVQPRRQVLAANTQGITVYNTVQIDRVGDYFACTNIGPRLIYHNLYSIPVRPGNGGPNYIWVCGRWYTFEFVWANNNNRNLVYNTNTGFSTTPTPWTATCNGFGLGLNPTLIQNPNQVGIGNPINNPINNLIIPGVGLRPGATFRSACSAGTGNIGINTGINSGVTNTYCINGRLRPNAIVPAGLAVLANEVPLTCLTTGVQLIQSRGNQMGMFPLYRTGGQVNGNTCQFGWRDSANNCTNQCGYIDD